MYIYIYIYIYMARMYTHTSIDDSTTFHKVDFLCPLVMPF
jgi:hypothetical protein